VHGTLHPSIVEEIARLRGTPIKIGYVDAAARGRGRGKGKRAQAFRIVDSLENVPASVIEAVRSLYTRYMDGAKRRNASPGSTSSTSARAETNRAPYLDNEYKVTVVTTDGAENEMVEEALLCIPHEFINKQLLRDALNADGNMEHQRLSRLGDLVQTFLLSEVIYEGTNLSSGMLGAPTVVRGKSLTIHAGFVENQLKQTVGRNSYQAKRMVNSPLWRCTFLRRSFSPEVPTKVPQKRPADVLEAVLGAVYLDTRSGSHWRPECLKVMVRFQIGTDAAMAASEELVSYGFRRSSWDMAENKKSWEDNYSVMSGPLKIAEDRLLLMGLVV